jgi:hypothetical protein
MEYYITLKTEMSFSQALKNLNTSKCYGIRPKNNLNFLVLSKVSQGNLQENGNADFLKWEGDNDFALIRVSQYQNKWSLVVIKKK